MRGDAYPFTVGHFELKFTPVETPVSVTNCDMDFNESGYIMQDDVSHVYNCMTSTGPCEFGDDTNQNTVVNMTDVTNINALFDEIGCAVDPITIAVCDMDYDSDGSIGLTDLNQMLLCIGLAPSCLTNGDTNSDGNIDVVDVEILTHELGTTCP